MLHTNDQVIQRNALVEMQPYAPIEPRVLAAVFGLCSVRRLFRLRMEESA